ncbi:MAG: hypothetical protein H6Q30_2141 [Bacteroidetes bacterium]|nr:hypothetical protein [Bacteroidota bacterium]
MEQPEGTRTYALIDARPRAIVIHCSDPRFQKAFDEFIREGLLLEEGEYIPLVISGGVASLSEPLKLPKEFKFMKERIELFLERYSELKRIVLINHEDCRHYEQLKSVLGRLFLQRVRSIGEKQTNDLKIVAKMLLGYAVPGLQIELYYARFCPGETHAVTFEKIPL